METLSREITAGTEKFIARYMQKCIFFNGLQNKACKEGVEYGSQWDKKKLPCIDGKNKCGFGQFPTREEALKYWNEAMDAADSIMAGRCPTCGAELDREIVECGRYKGHGRLLCPKCRKVVAQI